LSLGLLCWSDAASETTERDRAKAFRVKSALTSSRLTAYEGNHPFCENLFKALATGSSQIRYVKPVLVTNNTYDTGLAKYHACESYPGGRSRFTFDKIEQIGTHDLRLYVIPLKTGATTSYIEFLYGEDPSDPDSPAARYTQIDLNVCESTGGALVAPENSSRISTPNGINAVIQYQGRYFIYSFGDWQRIKRDSLEVWSADSAKNRLVCAWNPPPPKPAQEPQCLANC
jgi:hypothetical protein